MLKKVRALALSLGAAAAGFFSLAIAAPRGADGSTPPTIRLEVKSNGQQVLEELVPVLEGRLMERLKDQQDFRLVPAAAQGDYSLLLEIDDLRYTSQGEYDRGYDAEDDPNSPKYTASLGGELDLYLTLIRAAGQDPLYEDSLTVVGSRKLEQGAEDRTKSQLLDDLMERVAEKLPRTLKKRLRR